MTSLLRTLSLEQGDPAISPRSRSLAQALAGSGVMLKQETSQCCRCLCCQPPIDFLIQDFSADWQPGDELQTKLYIKEESGYWGRCFSCFAPASRSLRYNVHDGSDAQAPVIMSHYKETTLPHCCRCFLPTPDGPVPIPFCCCCCLPYLTTADARGQVLGTTRYVCDAFPSVPKFDVFDERDERTYRVKPDTCCAGCCVRCRFGTQGADQTGRKQKKCCKVPFHIRAPHEPFEKLSDAELTELWSGWKTECCTGKVTFGLKFQPAPEQEQMGGQRELTAGEQRMMVNRRATLIGTALLLHLTETEHEAS